MASNEKIELIKNEINDLKERVEVIEHYIDIIKKRQEKTSLELNKLKVVLSKLIKKEAMSNKTEIENKIEIQKLKIHDIKKTKIGIFWLLSQSKKGFIASISIPLLPSFKAFSIVNTLIPKNLEFSTLSSTSKELIGLDILILISLAPLISFIIVYFITFKISISVIGSIVKYKILSKEKKKLKRLEESKEML